MFRRVCKPLSALADPEQLSVFLRHVLSFPAIRALLASTIFYLVAFIICRFRFWRDPHSAFFQSETVYELSYSTTRTEQALRYVQQANTSQAESVTFAKGQPNPLLCVAFVTVKRDPVQYLAESVGSLLEGLYLEERSALYLHVLFANTEPAVHPAWHMPWVTNLIDAPEGYNVSNADLEMLQKVERERNFHVKGVFDYVSVLKRCMDTAAPYILIAEDDISFIDGWMTKTLDALKQLKQTADTAVHRASTLRPWLYLRLFYTETPLMWDEKYDFWYANMPLAFGLAMTSGLVILCGIRRRHPTSRAYLDNSTIAVICLVTIPAFTALVFMIGKYSLHPLRGLVKMNTAGCCTQAMVYPRTQVSALIKFLERNKGQTDLLIEEYADSNGMDRFALAPQVAQHIGLVSSRGNAPVNTQSTWAFYFETNDPEKLRREHEMGMKQGMEPWADLRSI